METYRSGHNGAHSKCVSLPGHEGSNPSVSAKKGVSQFYDTPFLCGIITKNEVFLIKTPRPSSLPVAESSLILSFQQFLSHTNPSSKLHIEQVFFPCLSCISVKTSNYHSRHKPTHNIDYNIYQELLQNR